MSSSPHDALFRFTFGQPEHAAAFFGSVLPPALAQAFDWSSLQPQPGTQIDKRLRRQQSDLLFTARIGHRSAVLYLLVEHKSRNDPWAALQMLGYVVGIWRGLRRQRPRSRRLPLVLPVLLHHGRRPWSAATQVEALLDGTDLPEVVTAALLALQPRFRYLVVSLADCSPDHLRGMTTSLLGKVTLAAMQFLPGASTDDVVRAIVHWADLVRQVLLAPSGREAFEALSTYVLSTTNVEPEVLIEVVDRVVEHGASTHMKTTAARLRAEGRIEGKSEGKLEGKLEGKVEGKAEGRAEGELAGRRNLLLQILTARFGSLDAVVRGRIDSACCEDLDRWAVRCVGAASMAAVFVDD